MNEEAINEVAINDSEHALNWGPGAPRGGKVVMARVLKENATVPLFFAQTLIASLRDVGYNHTTSALCEHIDNAIEAGATEIRVFIRQAGKKGDYETDIAVYDNGRGMSPVMLKVATSFGASTSYDNRNGIGRYGMGMKTAALSMSPVLELYSWQEQGAFYNMTLDVEAIGKERANLVELPDPVLLSELPDEVAGMFIKPMSWPKDQNDQDIFATREDNLNVKLGSSGTIVFLPKCDRLTYAKAQTLGEHAVKEMARVYRRAIAKGLRLHINNRQVEIFDPTYSIASARHTRYLDTTTKHSSLVFAKPVNIRVNERGEAMASITIRLYKLPIEEWYSLPRKTLRNDLRVFDGHTVSILRNDREVFAGAMPELTGRHSVTNWYRIQIDFPGVLDEAFGVAANKQGVRPKGYVIDEINAAIGNDIAAINEEIKRYQGKQASARQGSKPSLSEVLANEADTLQSKPLQELTADEQTQLEANLRGLAVSLKRENETDEQTYERIKSSKYLIEFRHDEYWPFYHVEHRFGRVILTINTAHPFFGRLYDPLYKMSLSQKVEDDGTIIEMPEPDVEKGPIVALDLLLLSLARTQTIMSANNQEVGGILDTLRREWSEAYRVQLRT